LTRFVSLLILLSASASLAFDHDYAGYGHALASYVTDGRVDYEGLSHDRAALDGLLLDCASVGFDEYSTFSHARQIAFMINLYNAATLVLILDNYPIASIKDAGGLFSSPWNKKFISLFNHSVGLGHIEHDILRSEFKEPRIHFALASASASSPHLKNEPYLSGKLEQQLNEAEQAFMTARPDVNSFNDNTLYLSPIFRWYAADFESSGGILQFVRKYFPEINPDTKIIYNDYDWNLNSLQSTP
jgi:hypothetical protein